MFISAQPISNVLGAILVFLSLAMFGCIPPSLFFDDGIASAFLQSGVISLVLGGILWLYQFKSSAKVNKREGYLIVGICWVSICFLGTLPYLLSGEISSFTDAFFESTSGITTTGATILKDIEATAPSLLLWRSLTQWIGGMGIIVLTVALFPLLGVAGIELFVAEAPGPTSDKIHPRIKDTARTLWYIYFGGTIVLLILFWVEGMTWFDAVNHSFTTMATGGFSTKNTSIAFFNSSAIEYTMVVFMLLSGTNYSLLYFGLKGKFDRIYKNDEWRLYVAAVIVTVLMLMILIQTVEGIEPGEEFRKVLFNAVSIITTSGFATADYISWSPGITFLFFTLLFLGACGGSTSGGIKVIRHWVFMRNSILEFKRILHPRALIRLKVNKKLVAPSIIMHIMVFLLVYLLLFVLGAFLLTILGVDLITAMGASASCVSNVGPGIGEVGPVDNFSQIPILGKYILCFLMICGRLELFTFLVLFTPYFWRRN